MDPTLLERWFDAIQQNEIDEVEALYYSNPDLLHTPAPRVDGGAALCLAAQYNHLELVKRMLAWGANDLQQALSRASMYAHREVTEFLVEQGADPNGLYAEGATHYGPVILAACESMNPEAIRLLVELGADPSAQYRTAQETVHSPIGFVLGGYGRNRARKHACIDVLLEAGVACPDTPIMALHRGRIDDLVRHLELDPTLLNRRLSLEELYMPELGFTSSSTMAPIEGTTLLHLAIEYDEFEVADRLLERGADVNARATGEEGDGHTPLFHAAASCGTSTGTRARFLLEHGADPNLRAALRHPEGGWDAIAGRLFQQVTALEYAMQFAQAPDWCNRESIQVLLEHRR